MPTKEQYAEAAGVTMATVAAGPVCGPLAAACGPVVYEVVSWLLGQSGSGPSKEERAAMNARREYLRELYLLDDWMKTRQDIDPRLQGPAYVVLRNIRNQVDADRAQPTLQPGSLDRIVGYYDVLLSSLAERQRTNPNDELDQLRFAAALVEKPFFRDGPTPSPDFDRRADALEASRAQAAAAKAQAARAQAALQARLKAASGGTMLPGMLIALAGIGVAGIIVMRARR